MKKIKELMPEAYDFNGKLSLKQAIPLGLQHVMAMFVGNLTPLLIITGACGIGAGSEYASVQVALLQNAMIIAGIVTLIQLFSIGPVGGKVPIIMGTSSGFIGVFSSITKVMGAIFTTCALYRTNNNGLNNIALFNFNFIENICYCIIRNSAFNFFFISILFKSAVKI